MGFKRPLKPLGRRHRSGYNSLRNKNPTPKEWDIGKGETGVFDGKIFPASANPIDQPIKDEESE